METQSNLKEELLTRGGLTSENSEDFDFHVEPLDDGIYKSYRFDYTKGLFVEYKNDEFDEQIKRVISEQKYKEIMQGIINKKENLNFPSFWLRFFATLLFLIVILVITVILVMIWAMLILDLVFFSFAIFILKRSVMLLWVLRVTLINFGYFTNLKRELNKLNKEYEKKLVWTLNSSEKLLTLKISEGKDNNTNS